MAIHDARWHAVYGAAVARLYLDDRQPDAEAMRIAIADATQIADLEFKNRPTEKEEAPPVDKATCDACKRLVYTFTDTEGRYIGTHQCGISPDQILCPGAGKPC